MEKKLVYLGLGGNQGNPLLCLQQALTLLSSHTETVSQLKISHYYRTAPVYYESPYWFVNAVCSFWTSLFLPEVFQLTQAIEKQLGKVEKPKNADRPIDIDILFYGTELSQEQAVEVPHPRWKERLFVLMPLADLTKEISFHTKEGFEHHLLHDLIQSVKDQGGQTISLLEKNPYIQ